MNGKHLVRKELSDLFTEHDLTKAGFKQWHSQEDWMVKLDETGKITQAYAYVGYIKHEGHAVKYYREM